MGNYKNKTVAATVAVFGFRKCVRICFEGRLILSVFAFFVREFKLLLCLSKYPIFWTFRQFWSIRFSMQGTHYKFLLNDLLQFLKNWLTPRKFSSLRSIEKRWIFVWRTSKFWYLTLQHKMLQVQGTLCRSYLLVDQLKVKNTSFEKMMG